MGSDLCDTARLSAIQRDDTRPGEMVGVAFDPHASGSPLLSRSCDLREIGLGEDGIFGAGRRVGVTPAGGTGAARRSSWG